MSDVKSTESEHHLAFQECPNCRENYATCDCSKEQIEKCREDTLCKCGHDMRDHVRKIQTGKYTDCLECNNCSECGESKDCKCKEFREDTKSESMKFDNAKDAEEYLENEAKEGETIFLDEKATSTQPRRVGSFTKDTKSELKQVHDIQCNECLKRLGVSWDEITGIIKCFKCVDGIDAEGGEE